MPTYTGLGLMQAGWSQPKIIIAVIGLSWFCLMIASVFWHDKDSCIEESKFKFGDKVKNQIGRIGIVVAMNPATHVWVGKTYVDYKIKWDDGEYSREYSNDITRLSP